MNLGTKFKDKNREDRLYGKAVTDVALNAELITLVREVIQNTRDARLDSQTPELVFRLEILEGDALDTFLEQIDWETLRNHLDAVAEEDDIIGVRNVLDQIDEGELYVLAVEDRNAEGLDGDEDSKQTNYSSLVKDFGITTKESDEGGSHGVGASVLWGFSGLKTVIFNSTPADVDPEKTPPRLVGRVDLPDHELDDDPYSGDGWIGVDDPDYDRPVSAWGDEANFGDVAEQLRITRSGEPGTTALVVGFREPTRKTRDPDEVIDALAEATAQYYWPLIVDGGISVSVQGPADPEPREVDPREVPDVEPFVDAYEQLDSDTEDISDGGSIGTAALDFQVPRRSDGTTFPEGSVELVARVPAGKEAHGRLVNKVAMFRSARHVVKYRQYDHVARSAGQDFHGLLLVGGANHPIGTATEDLPEDDRAIELFFRDAEPEAHDTWEEGTPKLEHNYEGSGVGRIRELLVEDVRGALHRLLGEAQTEDDDIVSTVGSEFPFFSTSQGTSIGGGSDDGGGGGSRAFEEISSQSWFDGYKHNYEGQLVTTDSDPAEWKVAIEIHEVDGSNVTIDEIAVDRIDAAPAADSRIDDGVAHIDVPDGTTTVDFELESEEVGDGSDLLGQGQTRLSFEYDFDSG